MVQGVKINCLGDMTALSAVLGVGKFSEVKVPKEDLVYPSPVTSISQLVGLPLWARKCQSDNAWNSIEGSDIFQNQAATFLHMEADPKKETWQADPSKSTWGWAPMIWQNNVGSVLVVRRNIEHVARHQVKALCHFCQFKMQLLFEAYLEGGPKNPTREQVMEYLTPKKFKEYFEEFKPQEASEDCSWADAILGNLVKGVKGGAF